MKNELIKITTNEEGKRLVSARELHEFLEVTERFSNWFERYCKYGFEENIDYVGCKVFNILARQELQDYAMTIEMAKEFSMLQRTEKGSQARKYFIECERKSKEIDLKVKLPQTYLEALKALVASEEEKQKLIAENAAQKPFADIAKERIAKGEKISIRDANKGLNLKQGQITGWAKKNGYIHKTHTEVNAKGEKYFKVYKEGSFNCIGITEEGISFINENIEDIRSFKITRKGDK